MSLEKNKGILDHFLAGPWLGSLIFGTNEILVLIDKVKENKPYAMAVFFLTGSLLAFVYEVIQSIKNKRIDYVDSLEDIGASALGGVITTMVYTYYSGILMVISMTIIFIIVSGLLFSRWKTKWNKKIF